MDAWHRYVERQKNQVLKDSVMDNCEAYIFDYDEEVRKGVSGEA